MASWRPFALPVRSPTPDPFHPRDGSRRAVVATAAPHTQSAAPWRRLCGHRWLHMREYAPHLMATAAIRTSARPNPVRPLCVRNGGGRASVSAAAAHTQAAAPWWRPHVRGNGVRSASARPASLMCGSLHPVLQHLRLLTPAAGPRAEPFPCPPTTPGPPDGSANAAVAGAAAQAHEPFIYPGAHARGRGARSAAARKATRAARSRRHAWKNLRLLTAAAAPRAEMCAPLRTPLCPCDSVRRASVAATAAHAQTERPRRRKHGRAGSACSAAACQAVPACDGRPRM